jgi:hypothetical protein
LALRPGQLKALVITNGINTALIALVTGMAGAAVLASALRALPLGEASLDPAVMAGVAGLLHTVALCELRSGAVRDPHRSDGSAAPR